MVVFYRMRIRLILGQNNDNKVRRCLSGVHNNTHMIAPKAPGPEIRVKWKKGTMCKSIVSSQIFLSLFPLHGIFKSIYLISYRCLA